ncbi:MAG: hypothetical protein R3229_15160 [Alphaproteobacteria bacterium]|nr:hypothetical protein [Alphaproteobacteria bacterium]
MTAAAIALIALVAIVGARPAGAGVTAGERAFNSGDFVTAIRELQRPAYDGNAAAQYYMGVIYHEGLGVNRSPEDALVWFTCAQTRRLPEAFETDARRRQSQIMDEISPFALERVELHAESLCGRALAQKRAAADKMREKTPLERIQPVRGFWASILFFPGDTMMTGAAVVFHGLGLTFISDILIAMAKTMGDFLFGLLALIGWFIIARVVKAMGDPVWKMILARDPLAHTGKGGDASGQEGAERESG